MLALALFAAWAAPAAGDVPLPVPAAQRGRLDAERAGYHDAANIRTVFYNFGMVGDYPPNPQKVDLSVFHSVEVPEGSGLNYSDGITPFVLSRIVQRDGDPAYVMETGFRERQGLSPRLPRVMRFEPRPGYFQADPNRNRGRSPALSNDNRTWPDTWPDRLDDPDDPGWRGAWNGYFGKRAAADQESFTVMDDDFYDAWNYVPDNRDTTRRGLGLRVQVRGFQWSNPQAQNVIFWHYDITNEGTTDYNENIIFGLYMDSGVGGSVVSCDDIAESDDDNAFFDHSSGLNLVYTWDRFGHGGSKSSNCAKTGYLGYAYLETPGKPADGQDNDDDGILDEKRDDGPGQRIVGRDNILAAVAALYDTVKFQAFYGPLRDRPAYKAGVWWTGDEDMDWNVALHDVGADGVKETGDSGELDGLPTQGEPNFDRTDLNESDQVGLTGFKMNRINCGLGNLDCELDGVLFYTDDQRWPQTLYEQFTATDPADRFDEDVANNYNIGFLFASGPFTLEAGKTERFSLALAYGADLTELRATVKTVQTIYNANYQFAVPPPVPTAHAEAGDGFVTLTWDDAAERGVDPVTNENDFEGYRVYRATDPEFRDPKVITTGRGTGPIGNGQPMAQFDLIDDKSGFSNQVVEGVAYWLGEETGIRHTWTDTTATNGQLYYYAVTAYDFGSDSLGFYPSENAISVSRTARGGTVLASNVVTARPNPRVLGHDRAAVTPATQVAGPGSGSVGIEVKNSALVPQGHLFRILFTTDAPESVRATRYILRDSTDHLTLFATGTDFDGMGLGPVGAGLLPIIRTQAIPTVDAARSVYLPGNPTNTYTRIRTSYLNTLSPNLRRPGYPADSIRIVFDDVVRDTAVALGIGFPARPCKFKIWSYTGGDSLPMDFRIFESNPIDSTLSRSDELLDIITYAPWAPTTPQPTWRCRLDNLGTVPIQKPGRGDVYRLELVIPFGADDEFVFESAKERIDPARAYAESGHPYVVPNPYVGAASFEPERFAESGRGDRRMEFRALPANCTIRIYSVRGDLVQTLRHDGSNDGFVAWDLRTKDNLDVAPGLYVFQVEAPGAKTSIGKFAVIK